MSKLFRSFLSSNFELQAILWDNNTHSCDRINNQTRAVIFEKTLSIAPFELFETLNSKIDGSFIEMLPDIGTCKLLYKRGIREQIQSQNNNSEGTCNIGFNSKEQMWFGWSHRAIFGFGIGYVISEDDTANDVNFKVGYEIKSLNECKELAILFAKSVV